MAEKETPATTNNDSALNISEAAVSKPVSSAEKVRGIGTGVEGMGIGAPIRVKIGKEGRLTEYSWPDCVCTFPLFSDGFCVFVGDMRCVWDDIVCLKCPVRGVGAAEGRGG